jgi:hypothetical protein
VGRPSVELERIAGEALPAARLAQIWRELPEKERFSFVLSLDECLVEKVIELTMPAALAQEETDHGTRKQIEVR